MITCTASGKFNFNDIYFGKSIGEWVEIVNKQLAKGNEFKVIRLKPGKFGYDVLATMISNVFQCLIENPNDIMLYMRNSLDIEPYMVIVHGGCISSYLYWKNFQPDINSDYIKPKNPIINDYNNDKVTTYFIKLPEDEQQIFYNTFNCIMNLVVDVTLSAGLNALSV